MFENTTPQFLSIGKNQDENDESGKNNKNENEDKSAELFRQYMTNARININLRQVWNDDDDDKIS